MRRFLGIIAFLAILVIAGAIAWRLLADPLMKIAFVPGDPFAENAVPAAPEYAKIENWVARPELPANPALWAPEGYLAAPKPAAAAFFVAPTAFISRSGWNADLADAETNDRLADYVKAQASAFNGVAEIWAPRYRQATFGAFLKPGPDAEKALAIAYSDVVRAFDIFLAAQPADRPILLAAHSQGSRHLLRLMKDREEQLKDRLVAAYAIGWAIALPEDVNALGIRPCTDSEQSGCLLGWQSYAADGELEKALAKLALATDLDAQPLGQRRMLCVNPLTGGQGDAGPERNVGTLIDGKLDPRRAGAQCDDRGLLLVSPAPTDIGQLILPGGNFHAYDYQLFWANIRADAEARLSAYGTARHPVTADLDEPGDVD